MPSRLTNEEQHRVRPPRLPRERVFEWVGCSAAVCRGRSSAGHAAQEPEQPGHCIGEPWVSAVHSQPQHTEHALRPFSDGPLQRTFRWPERRSLSRESQACLQRPHRYVAAPPASLQPCSGSVMSPITNWTPIHHDRRAARPLHHSPNLPPPPPLPAGRRGAAAGSRRPHRLAASGPPVQLRLRTA